MAIGKKRATDSTLYALIAFVALFIVATSAAVIFYLKFEEQRNLADTAQTNLGRFATPSEVQRIGALVGSERPGKSRIATMIDYLDRAIKLIVPGLPADTSAEVKVNETVTKVRQAVAGAAKQHPELKAADDPNIALLASLAPRCRIRRIPPRPQRNNLGRSKTDLTTQ